MKILYYLGIFIFLNYANAKDIGQTQITAEDGIEVFQKEKFYLLKNNVEIISDNFDLKANIVKAYFNEDLYDITKIHAEENVLLNSNQRNLSASGNILEFSFNEEKIKIFGKNSKITLNKTNMFSNETIEIDNINGTFHIKGKNSKLENDGIFITGYDIKGKFASNKNINEIIELNVEDQNICNIKTEEIDMFSLKAVYNKEKNIIELIDNVKVIRGKEIMTGDYGYVDIASNSYKVNSNDSGKVKVLISQENE